MMTGDFFYEFERLLKAYIEKRVQEEIGKHTEKLNKAMEEWTNNKYAQFGMTRKMEEIENAVDSLEWKINNHIKKEEQA